MNSLSFIRSTVAALLISAVTAVVFSSLLLLFTGPFAVQISTTVASFFYMAFLFSQSKAKFGKLTLLFCFCMVSALALYVTPSLWVTALINVSSIWLVRTVYFHNNVLLAFADLIITGITLLAAVAAALQSHNLFLAFWSFFLLQGMILPLLNYSVKRFLNKDVAGSSPITADNFQRAQRDAEQALRKLAQSH